MIEKAETSLGIPSPTELSVQVAEEEKEQGEPSLRVLNWDNWLHGSACRLHRDQRIQASSSVNALCLFLLLQVKPAMRRTKRQQETDLRWWEVRWEC